METLFVDGNREKAAEEVFLDSFSAFDLLWIGLATLTAYQMGARRREEEVAEAQEVQEGVQPEMVG